MEGFGDFRNKKAGIAPTFPPNIGSCDQYPAATGPPQLKR
jgi:hypothetical protein